MKQLTEGVIAGRRRGKVYAGWIYSVGRYQPRWQINKHLNSALSRQVVLAKRKSESAIGRFGQIIATRLNTALMDGREYVITHVPEESTDSERCVTDLLAQSIYSCLHDKANVSLATVLVQAVHKSRRQHRCLSDRMRAENVRGIYAVTNPALVAGKCIILVDDVLTSGATMVACAQVLREAGAASVMGVTMARTERSRPPVYASNWTRESGISTQEKLIA